MLEPSSQNGLSPLDQVRQVEADITRKVITAREASEHNAANTRAQAALLKEQARGMGEREGQIRYKETIAKAEEQSKEIVAQAQHEADNLRRMGQIRMEHAVHEALSIVLGLEESVEADES